MQRQVLGGQKGMMAMLLLMTFVGGALFGAIATLVLLTMGGDGDDHD